MSATCEFRIRYLFRISDFEFVSDFEFRISSFRMIGLELPFSPRGSPFPRRPRRRIALQSPQGPLNIRGDTFAFLVERRPERGENLPVFSQDFQLFQHLIDLRKGEMRSD